MKELLDKIKKARFVWVCGNGGSSATAEHLTEDLFSKGIRAICLNSNNALMTMIANDYDYKFIFSRQIEFYANSDDLLITISCSGTSENIVQAQRIAKLHGLSTYSFPTFPKYARRRSFEDLENDHIELVHLIKNNL